MNKSSFEEVNRTEEAVRDEIRKKIKLEVANFHTELDEFFNSEVETLTQSQFVRIEQLRSDIKHYKREISKINQE